jgi:ABC-type bacteriocin/lantibiotic exporter with double-glycine peptidase domain
MLKRLKLILSPVLLIAAISCGGAPVTPGSGDGSTQAECKFVDTTTLKQSVDLAVPYTEQEPNFCGPASMEMVLRYYGKNVDQTTIGSDIVGSKGVGSEQLSQKAIDMGFSVVDESCGINNLLGSLDAGDPVIVRVLNNSGDNGHFMVVVGYDQKTKKVYLNDPANPDNTEMLFDDFERIWNITTLGPTNNSSYFMMVITPQA